MTAMWLILKTDPAKEFAVANALSALGHTVWVPTTIATAYEKFTAGPGVTLRRKKAIERPLMAELVLAAYDPESDNWPKTRHLQKCWGDKFGVPYLVPHGELMAFRERVEAVNAAETARIAKASMGKRKAKRVLKLDPKLTEELKNLLFGNRMEQAA